jgi:hypothetical protein
MWLNSVMMTEHLYTTTTYNQLSDYFCLFSISHSFTTLVFLIFCHMALKCKRQASSSRKTSSTSNSHPSTSKSQQMESSRKPSPTLTVNSILQELLGGPAGSSSAYRKANSEANQGLRSASQSQKT